MNTGLGNRDNYYSKFAVFIDSGRIIDCPLCLDGKNDEIHLLMECREMEGDRQEVKVEDGISLESKLREIKREQGTSDSPEIIRLFLGQERRTSREVMARRGMALDLLLTLFFRRWSEKRQTLILRNK